MLFSYTVLLYTVIGRKKASWSISCTPPAPAYCVSTCPFSERTEAWSSFASYRPVARLVAPGPAIVRQAAIFPVSLL